MMVLSIITTIILVTGFSSNKNDCCFVESFTPLSINNKLYHQQSQHRQQPASTKSIRIMPITRKDSVVSLYYSSTISSRMIQAASSLTTRDLALSNRQVFPKHRSLFTPRNRNDYNDSLRQQPLIAMSFAKQTTSESSSSSSSSAISKNKELVPGIDIINANIDELYSKLSSLRENSYYFRQYSVDILGSCEYMSQELFECYTDQCEIYPEDDDDVRNYMWFACNVFLPDMCVLLSSCQYICMHV